MFTSRMRVITAFAIACAGIGLGAPSATAAVNMIFTPSSQTAFSGEIVEITLSIQSNQPIGQQLNTLDAILVWDPTQLQFLNFNVAGAGYAWFASGFFPNQDGVNVSLADGDGLFTILVSPGAPAIAPPAPAALVVATFRFMAAGGSSLTTLNLSPTEGPFSQTRVLAPGGFVVTGDISSVATVTVLEPPCSSTACDVNCDTFYTHADIAAAVDVYLGVDTIPAHVVAADANCDGLADARDLQPLIDFLLLVL